MIKEMIREGILIAAKNAEIPAKTVLQLRVKKKGRP